MPTTEPWIVAVLVLGRGGEDDHLVGQRRGVAEAQRRAVELAELVGADRLQLVGVDREVAGERLHHVGERELGDDVAPAVVAAVKEPELIAEDRRRPRC